MFGVEIHALKYIRRSHEQSLITTHNNINATNVYLPWKHVLFLGDLVKVTHSLLLWMHTQNGLKQLAIIYAFNNV